MLAVALSSIYLSESTTTDTTGKNIDTIYTKGIGGKLRDETEEPLPYFYLDLAVLGDKDKIKRTEIAEREADKFLSSTKDGEWWKVVPNGVWPLKYFGKFERAPNEELKDWEKRLDDDVRKILIDKIEQKYKDYEEKKVKMIITRACKYIPLDEPMDTGD